MARARPVGVTVVSTSGNVGKRFSSASMSGTDACTSPTDTACTQMLRWSRTFGPRPKRCENPCQWLRSRKPRNASAPIHSGEIR